MHKLRQDFWLLCLNTPNQPSGDDTLFSREKNVTFDVSFFFHSNHVVPQLNCIIANTNCTLIICASEILRVLYRRGKKKAFAFSLTCHWNLHGSFFNSLLTFSLTQEKQFHGWKTMSEWKQRTGYCTQCLAWCTNVLKRGIVMQVSRPSTGVIDPPEFVLAKSINIHIL